MEKDKQKLKKLRRGQLDQLYKTLGTLSRADLPSGAWIRDVRGALGMSATQGLSVIAFIYLLATSSLNAQESSECSFPTYKAKRSGPTNLSPDSHFLKINTMNHAQEKERTLRFAVLAPGRLHLRNAGKNSFDAHLSLLSSSGRSSYRGAFFGTVAKGKTVMMPVIPGDYEVRIGESGEIEELTCPPLLYQADVKLMAPDAMLAPLLRGPWPDKTKLAASPQTKTYQTTLATLNPRPIFFVDVEKPSLIEIALTKNSSPQTRLHLEGTTTARLVRVIVWRSVYFSLTREDGLPFDRVDIASFTIKAIPFQGERIFEWVPKKAEVNVLDRVAAKLVLKNLASLDFRKVTLVFEPIFKGAQTPPGMTAMEIGKGRPAWSKTFAHWKAGEEKIVDFGVLFPRIKQTGDYSLNMGLTTLEAQDGPVLRTEESEFIFREQISLSEMAKSASPKMALALEQANTVEHPDYETQLKIPVMTNCAKKYPQYGQSFQECQGLIFKWRNHCSASHSVTTLAFVECVRKGLQDAAPELLKRPPQ